jgi:hypothetical protein
MAVRPTKNAEWATDDIQELKDINGDQIDEVLDNKIEPTPTWKSTGQLFQENLPYPYFNYQFNLIDEWIQHLDGRFVVGDIHMTLTSTSPTPATISTQLGGTWVAAGTDTVGTAAVSVFEKTA